MDWSSAEKEKQPIIVTRQESNGNARYPQERQQANNDTKQMPNINKNQGKNALRRNLLLRAPPVINGNTYAANAANSANSTNAKMTSVAEEFDKEITPKSYKRFNNFLTTEMVRIFKETTDEIILEKLVAYYRKLKNREWTEIYDSYGENKDFDEICCTIQDIRCANKQVASMLSENEICYGNNCQNNKCPLAQNAGRKYNKTGQKVNVGNRDRVVYEGVRGGKYVKMNGGMRSLKSLEKGK